MIQLGQVQIGLGQLSCPPVVALPLGQVPGPIQALAACQLPAPVGRRQRLERQRLLQPLAAFLQLVHRFLNIERELLARRCQGHALLFPREKSHLKLTFEGGNLAAQSGLRHKTTLSGLAEVLRFRRC